MKRKPLPSFFKIFEKKIKKIYSHCLLCGAEITIKGQKYCSVSCLKKHYKPATFLMPDIISDDERKNKLNEVYGKFGTLTGTANYFGVSDNTIKKWLKKYGIKQKITRARKKNT